MFLSITEDQLLACVLCKERVNEDGADYDICNVFIEYLKTYMKECGYDTVYIRNPFNTSSKVDDETFKLFMGRYYLLDIQKGKRDIELLKQSLPKIYDVIENFKYK